MGKYRYDKGQEVQRMKKPVLLVMAAGMGSRYGGLKQMDPITETGEIIMDFSLYDAMMAGFEKAVFIIRKEIEEDMKELLVPRAGKYMDIEFVCQRTEDMPGVDAPVPAARTKPWGTAHAIMSARKAVDSSFAVINADDYYGKEAFHKLHDFLLEDHSDSGVLQMGMAGFILKNTVSENGTVTRGVCIVDEHEMLQEVVETTGIAVNKDNTVQCDNDEVGKWITPDSHVSMNMWAAGPELFRVLEDGFVEFLQDDSKDPLKKEYLIPIRVGDLLHKNQVEVQVRETNDKWIGITYQEDTALAQEGFREMIAAGVYPAKLWA